jgi:hypothetical protein
VLVIEEKDFVVSCKSLFKFVVSLTSTYSNSNRDAGALLHSDMNPADAGQTVEECDATEVQ